MTIKAKLQIITTITIFLTLIIGIFVFSVNRELRKVIEENQKADEIVKGIFELNILSNDYILHPERRSYDQWQTRYDSTAKLLTEIKGSDDLREREIIEDLRENHVDIAETFLQLVAVLDQKMSDTESISQKLKERLIGRLSISSQAMVSGTFALSSQTLQELTERQQQISLFSVTAILIMALMVIISSFLAMSKILRPITTLQKGVNIIGKGNLGHKINIKNKDEIGALAAAFNTMASALKKSYTGLEEKVKARTAELEIAKNKSEALLASIGDGVFAIDREQKIVHFNQRAEEISGYQATEVLGKPYYDFLRFVKAKDKRENVEFIRKALKGEITEMTDHTVLVRKDKSEISVDDSAAPIKDKEGSTLGAIVVFRDASKVRELERARAELISFASHQLRAPLTYISGNVAMLKERDFDTESREFVDEIKRGVEEMKKLVSDVLNISRIEQGKIEFKSEPTQLEKIVDDLIKESSSIAKQRKVNTKYTKPTPPLPKLMIDPQYIHEVFKNVISNAVKYTRDKVTISLEKKDGNILFICSDNGIGIPKDEQSKIFAKFYVASNVAKAGTKGNGLGLSIAKALVEKMGGKNLV